MLIKTRLEEAFDKKNNDINNFVWKGEKVRNGDSFEQKVIKLVDCSIEQLKKYYNYCDKMLNNTNKQTPGRVVVLNSIQEQKNKCNTELFLRWLSKENNISKYSFMNIIRTFLDNNPTLDRATLTLDNVVGQCPYEYKDIPVDTVLDGCMDTLGIFNRKHITVTFLLRQGLWLNETERKELSTKGKLDPSKITDYLGINPNHRIKLSSKGLTLNQMKAMTTLKIKKYSEMSTLQLEVLRNRILYVFEKEVRFHIHQWNIRKNQIVKVLESKGVTDATFTV